MDNWIPIEQAKKDGTEYLLLCKVKCGIGMKENSYRMEFGSYREDYYMKEECWLDNSWDDFSTGFASTPLEPIAFMEKPEVDEDKWNL